MAKAKDESTDNEIPQTQTNESADTSLASSASTEISDAAPTADDDADDYTLGEEEGGDYPEEIEPILVKGHHINGYEQAQGGGFNVKVSKEVDGEHQHRTLFIDVADDASNADKLAALEAQL